MPDLNLLAINPVGILMVIVGLGGLIFFHELGHFLACRLTGTRVEAFSIGFGPQIWGWRRGHTVYRIGAIPLGGYVKMAAENPGDVVTGAPDEFTSKSYGAKLFIMLNGVIFNVIIAFVLFVWAFHVGVPFPKAEVGSVSPGSPAWAANLQKGDLIVGIDGREILGFDDLKLEISTSSADQVMVLEVLRGEERIKVPVVPEYSATQGFPLVGLTPVQEEAAARVLDGTPVHKAGGRSGDVVLEVDGKPYTEGLAAFLTNVPGVAPEAKTVTSKWKVRREDGSVETLSVEVPLARVPMLGVALRVERKTIRSVREGSVFAGLLRRNDEIESIDGRAIASLSMLRMDEDPAAAKRTIREIVIVRDERRKVLAMPEGATVETLLQNVAGVRDDRKTAVSPQPGGPAAAAGVLIGDEIVMAGGKEIRDLETLREVTRENGGKPLQIRVRREGSAEPVELTVKPRLDVRYTDAERHSSLGYAYPIRTVTHSESNVLAAIGTGVHRTGLTIRRIALTVRSLLTARVSARHIGGPIALAQVSYTFWEEGLAKYLYIMALISINLAILNLLPIPVLDGGQVVLLTLEKIRGKPLPERVIQGFQLVGLVAVLGLVALALSNDISGLLR